MRGDGAALLVQRGLVHGFAAPRRATACDLLHGQRRLAPAQYLSGFTRDDVLDYQISRGTDVPYVHYTYTFPNETIDFVLSGNYVLRVTEQGDETAVLFEVPFFVADQATGLSFATEPVMVPGSAYPFQQPVAVFQPPTALEGDVFNFTTCFVQNARYEQARCTERPLVTQQPRLRFFLQPEVAFEPQPADFFLDLSQLRPGGDLMATDLSASPMTAELEPDFARLGADLGTPRLNRQTVTQGALNGGEPQLAGEYVMTRFGYVPPDERPYRGDVFLLGSFNQWRYDPAYRMDWNAEEGRYELDVLLKQGLYEYQYATPEDTDTALRGPLPRRNDLYTALVYYRDLQFNTDRLISVQQVVQ
ncbi:MAG: type IX secretion system plug protein domain-containing protein, partial [Bacteroidota bacterium]